MCLLSRSLGISIRTSGVRVQFTVSCHAIGKSADEGLHEAMEVLLVNLCYLSKLHELALDPNA